MEKQNKNRKARLVLLFFMESVPQEPPPENTAVFFI